ncbi:MAG: undecaprenyl-diphosphate phosphatase [Bdellovibrio sp.]|nr:undecaprenyl-diphosphate phosphatase [Bdellovibrio sp.]
MTWLDVFILSLIEGLTEFIPVSSTGHLILAGSLLNITANEFTKAFDVIIQFGAILAVVFLYRERLKWNFSFYKKLFIAFLPAAVIGFLFKNKIDLLLESTTVVAWALIIGGVVLVFIDSLFRHQTKTEVSERSALIIGFMQCIAMIPGVSRSASTIIGGQIVGLSREKAAEFSFLLAIPTMAAATVYKLWKIRAILDFSQAGRLGLGVLLAFVFSILAIKFFIAVLNRYGFRYFGIYRIIVGVLVLVFSHSGAL